MFKCEFSYNYDIVTYSVKTTVTSVQALPVIQPYQGFGLGVNVKFVLLTQT